MDQNKKSQSGNLTKRHFAKFHERIQNKYAQMQMRIEKSKSMECISSLGEEFTTDNLRSLVKSESQEDKVITEDKCVENIVKYSVIIEDAYKKDSIAENCEEILLYESEVNSVMQEEEDEDVFFRNNLSLSVDNVYEASTEQELKADVVSSATSHRTTVRERILAVRERRREKIDKKKELKRRMSNCSNNSENVLLTPSTVQLFLSNKPVEALKKRNKVAAVTVALIEATGPENESSLDEKISQLYCRVRLGQEKHRSKAVRINDNLASWQEVFNFSLYEDNLLEITMWEKEKDVFSGRTVVDLSQLRHNKTHRMDLRLEEDDSIEILILVTINGTTQDSTEDRYDCERRQNEIMELKKNVMSVLHLASPDHVINHMRLSLDPTDGDEILRIARTICSWLLLNDDFEYVGMLHVTVYKAMGLSTSDCFAVVILGNDRFQTQTEHKTHDPIWMKMFTFVVKDATSILYITIYDEKKTDIVGKLAIPLLRIINGEKKWYALKNKACRERAKGNNPRILLEMNFYYNFVKQSVRLINPKERILLDVEPEFSRQRLSKNITRMKSIINWTRAASKLTKTLFEWESRRLNLIALTGWLIFWYFYEPWMLPLILLFPFFWYRPAEYHFTSWKPDLMWKPLHMSRSESKASINTTVSTTSIKEGPKTSLRQKLNTVTDMVTTVQNGIGNAASLGESVKNLFNFTEPLISFFSISGIFATSIVLYYIQCRYLIMAWGVHKFLRKILRPNRIPNNEVLDVLSRVPDDETLLDCKELPLLEDDDNNKRK